MNAGAAMAWWRYGLERGVLLPAAGVLPRTAAHSVALALGLMDTFTGLGGLLRKELQSSHGFTGRRLWMASWRRCSLPYLDLLYLTRASRGDADDPSRTGIHVDIPQSVVEHLRSGRPLFVVFGHFPFSSSVAAFTAVRRSRLAIRGADSAPAIAVAAARPGGEANGGTRRERLRSHAIRECAAFQLGDTALADFAWEDGSRSSRLGFQLLRAMQQPEALCLIALDPPWRAARSSVEPFAGWANFPISTNVARLATLTGAGITLVLPSQRGRTGFSVVLSEPFFPERFQGPVELTAVLRKRLEQHIGWNPADYQLGLGTDRRWDHERQSWVPVLDSVSGQARPYSAESPAVSPGEVHGETA
jgi:hypothetical protein